MMTSEVGEISQEKLLLQVEGGLIRSSVTVFLTST